MKVFEELESVSCLNTVATIGIFDGIHLAHQNLIKRINDLSKERKTESLLITFWPHPRYVLNKGADELRLLSTIDEKLLRLKEIGPDNVLLLPFTKEFADTPFKTFVSEVLVKKLKIQHLVVGFNHHFGKDREGNFNNLQELSEQYSFGLERLDKITCEGLGVSSSVIRQKLAKGEIELVNKMLARHYDISGIVEHGAKRGRQLGFPTANVKVPEKYKLIPASGVYAIQAIFDGGKPYNGMLNIGNRPTVDNKGQQTIEANLFDYEGNLYGKRVTLVFHSRIRDELKFESVDALKKQIQKDKLEIQSYFEKQIN